MKTYFFSFINKQGIPCLNIQVKATSRTEAIEEIAEDVMYILSMVVID